MITIFASQLPVERVWNISSIMHSHTQTKWTATSSVWLLDQAAGSFAQTEIEGEFLHQGTEVYGQLRDKPVMHQKADGQITLLCNSLKLTDLNGATYLTKGSTRYACDLLVKYGEESFTSQSWNFPSWWDNDSTVYIPLGLRSRMITVSFVNGFTVVVTTMATPAIERWFSRTGVPVYKLGTNPPTWQHTITVVAKAGTVVSKYATGTVTTALVTDAQIASVIASHNQTGVITPVTGLDTISLGTPEEVLANTVDYISRDSFQALRSVTSIHPVDFGELSVEASKSLRYVDENILLILQDLVRLRSETAVGLSQLFSSKEWRTAKNALVLLKEGKITKRKFRYVIAPFSNMFLGWKYVFAPNLNDLSRIGRGIAKAMFEEPKQRVHSRRITEVPLPDERKVRHTAVLTAEVNSFGERDWGMLQELSYLGHRWGLSPETVNLYDLLIYSFVVDWFIQFGDFFEAIDAYQDVENKFPVEYCVMSEKWEYSLKASEMVPTAYADGATGEVELSYYHRWISEDVPLPSVNLSAETSLSKHWAEAGFLVAGRL